MPARVLASVFLLSVAASPALASPVPTTVVVAGSMQSELGCPGDWMPGCVASQLGYDSNDGLWQGSFSLPGGSYEYKAALNGTWDENYGVGGAPQGPNIPLSLAGPGTVKFYYDHATHWITSSANSTIATAAGNFQSELGCSGDWDPSCLRSWLQDADGDGIYTFATTVLPVGAYEWKVALNEAWDVNYGVGGAQGGANLSFDVAVAGTTVLFSWDSVSKIPSLRIGRGNEVPEPAALGLLALGLAGCSVVRRRRR